MKKILFAVILIITLMFNVNASASAILSHKYNSNILVLMYHKLSTNPNEWSNYCTSPQKFESDIIYLKENGYVFLTASELADYKGSMSQKTVLLTFDDGYMSDYTYALPIIEKHTVKATFYVTGSFIGTPEYHSVDSLKKMSESPFVEIGNHSYDLHNKSYEQIQQLMSSNKFMDAVKDFEKNSLYLSSIIGKDIKTLSYPNGIYTDKVNAIIMANKVNITFSTNRNKFIYKLRKPVGRINRADSLTIQQLIQYN